MGHRPKGGMMSTLLDGFSMRRACLVALVAGLATIAALAPAADANVNVSNSGWAWSNPTPQGRTLHAVAFSAAGGYAVGDGGTALFTPDAGRTWSGLTTGTGANLERVQTLAPSTIVVGGGEGCVTRISVDGGQIYDTRIFNVAESGCEEPVAAFSFLSPQNGALLLKNGSIEMTSDGGETFSRETSVPGTAASSGGGSLVGADIHFISASSGIAFVNNPTTGASSAYATPDGGVSWTPVTLPRARACVRSFRRRTQCLRDRDRNAPAQHQRRPDMGTRADRRRKHVQLDRLLQRRPPACWR